MGIADKARLVASRLGTGINSNLLSVGVGVGAAVAGLGAVAAAYSSIVGEKELEYMQQLGNSSYIVMKTGNCAKLDNYYENYSVYDNEGIKKYELGVKCGKAVIYEYFGKRPKKIVSIKYKKMMFGQGDKYIVSAQDEKYNIVYTHYNQDSYKHLIFVNEKNNWHITDPVFKGDKEVTSGKKTLARDKTFESTHIISYEKNVDELDVLISVFVSIARFNMTSEQV